MKHNLSQTLYRKLLYLYPPSYRAQFEEGMLQTFTDLCNEKQYPHLHFMVGTFLDTFMGIIKEHLRLILTNTSMKFTPLIIIGLILLVPFGAVFALGMTWQLLYTVGYATRPDIAAVIPNFYLGFAVVFVFPALAFAINALALVIDAGKTGLRLALSMKFAKAHLFSLLIVFLAAGASLFAFGHDSIPCFVHGVFSQGLGNIWPLIEVCKNA